MERQEQDQGGYWEAETEKRLQCEGSWCASNGQVLSRAFPSHKITTNLPGCKWNSAQVASFALLSVTSHSYVPIRALWVIHQLQFDTPQAKQEYAWFISDAARVALEEWQQLFAEGKTNNYLHDLIYEIRRDLRKGPIAQYSGDVEETCNYFFKSRILDFLHLGLHYLTVISQEQAWNTQPGRVVTTLATLFKC